MKPKRLLFPRSVHFRDLCRFSTEVEALPLCQKIQFGTEHLKFFTPTSMMMLAKTCRKRARKHLEEEISYTGLGRHSYANNLGFSEALKLKGNPYPMGAFGGETYFPMSSLRRAQLEAVAAENGTEIGDAIQKRAEEIAQVVSQKKSKDLEDILANSFREILRNTFEHANVSGAMFCAQYWPTKKLVEICISDRGIGIKRSLQENPQFSEVTNRKALYLSLMPGVSSKAYLNKRKRASQRSEWDNAGYGLFLAHQLFGNLGWFAMASGERAIMIEDGKPISDFSCSVAGTVVSMRLNLSEFDEIKRCLDQIRERAFRIKEIIGVRSIDFASVEAFLKKRTDF